MRLQGNLGFQSAPDPIDLTGGERGTRTGVKRIARSTVETTTLVMPGRAVRNAEDSLVEREAHSRQGSQHAAIATDLRSARNRQSQADVVRAAKNLSEWGKYLPNNCIRAMVARGLHFTV
jgi:hypothetical protein